MEKESQLAALKALAIPDQSDKLMRYERHITKQLHDALDRLKAIQQQRQQEGSMGSSGQSEEMVVSRVHKWHHEAVWLSTNCEGNSNRNG